MSKYIAGLIVLIVIAVGLLLPVFQSAHESNCGQRDHEGSSEVVESNDQQPVSSWPNDIAGLVEQLNEWHRDELILYNEPESFPNQKPSGETGGWIGSHIQELNKLGADVRWDRSQKKYVIVEEK